MGKLACCRIQSFTILLLLLQVCHAMITCNVPSVAVGQNATLTCDFGTVKDIMKNKVVVDHLVENKTPDTWMTCYHDDGKDKHICIAINKQVIFDGITNNSLSLIFPASNETVGNFSCQMEGGDIYKTCAFQLKSDEGRGDGNSGGGGEGGGDNTGAIVGGVFGVLAVIAGAGVGILLWKKCQSPDNDNGEYIPLLPVSPENIEIKKDGNTIHIGWSPPMSDNAGNIVGYEIKCVDDEGEDYSQQTDGATCSVDIQNVVLERTYSIRLAAKTAQGVGKWSEVFTVERSGAKLGEARRKQEDAEKGKEEDGDVVADTEPEGSPVDPRAPPDPNAGEGVRMKPKATFTTSVSHEGNENGDQHIHPGPHGDGGDGGNVAT